MDREVHLGGTVQLRERAATSQRRRPRAAAILQHIDNVRTAAATTPTHPGKYITITKRPLTSMTDGIIQVSASRAPHAASKVTAAGKRRQRNPKAHGLTP